jgi:hypothetical protein
MLRILLLLHLLLLFLLLQLRLGLWLLVSLQLFLCQSLTLPVSCPQPPAPIDVPNNPTPPNRMEAGGDNLLVLDTRLTVGDVSVIRCVAAEQEVAAAARRDAEKS